LKIIEIKKKEERVKMPLDGVYINGFIIKQATCQKDESAIQYDYTAKKEKPDGNA
jgi:hypothetical protein